jgi:hypothetical protein
MALPDYQSRALVGKPLTLLIIPNRKGLSFALNQ